MTNIPNDDGLIREVNEAYRQDKAKEWWDKFGTRIIYATGAIILLTAVFVLVKQQQEAVQAERTIALFDALEQYQLGNLEEAEAAFAPLAEGDSKDGVAAIAQLYTLHAQMRQDLDTVDEDAFTQAAKDSPEAIAALAAIQAVYAEEQGAPVALAKEWFGAEVYALELANAKQSGEAAPVALPVQDVMTSPASLQQRIELLEFAEGKTE